VPQATIEMRWMSFEIERKLQRQRNPLVAMST